MLTFCKKHGACKVGDYNRPICPQCLKEAETREAEANAHLIAAAPAMYEALKILVDSMEASQAMGRTHQEVDFGSSLHIKALKALAEAGGKK